MKVMTKIKAGTERTCSVCHGTGREIISRSASFQVVQVLQGNEFTQALQPETPWDIPCATCHGTGRVFESEPVPMEDIKVKTARKEIQMLQNKVNTLQKRFGGSVWVNLCQFCKNFWFEEYNGYDGTEYDWGCIIPNYDKNYDVGERHQCGGFQPKRGWQLMIKDVLKAQYEALHTRYPMVESIKSYQQQIKGFKEERARLKRDIDNFASEHNQLEVLARIRGAKKT